MRRAMWALIVCCAASASSAIPAAAQDYRGPYYGPYTYYDAASDRFTVDSKSLADCGHTCHVAVKAKDYIFHPYQTR